MRNTAQQKAKSAILLWRALKESFVNLWRNKLVSIATIIVVTIIAFTFNILLAVNTAANEEIAKLSQKVDLILYLKDDVEYYTAKNIVEDIKKLVGVTDVIYVSKKDALAVFSKTYPKVEEFFEKFDVKNPLPASISIQTEKPSFHKDVEKFIDGSRYKDLFTENIAGGSGGITGDVVKNLRKITETTENILYFMLAAFIVGGILVIFNAIKLTIFARRKEIAVMKLVGASPFFIRLPYILEGIWYFTIAVILNAVLCILFAEQLAPIYTGHLYLILILELACGILIGITSSVLASQKHLNA